MQRILHNLGLKYHTDKSFSHVFNDRSFMDIYERYFIDFKDKNINFLEIGVLNGASLRVWQEYFGKESNILGLDIDPGKIAYNYVNIKIYIGSQNDTQIIEKIYSEHTEGFDVILDDGSHINSLTIDSFNLLFEKVKPGGYYIIEDTHCTYGDEWYKSEVDNGRAPSFEDDAKRWPGMFYNVVDFKNQRKDFNKFLLNLIENLDKKNSNVYSINIFSETIVIQKII